MDWEELGEHVIQPMFAIPLVVSVIGALMFLGGLYTVGQAFEQADWPDAFGTVIRSQQVSTGYGDKITARIDVAYEVDGKRHIHRIRAINTATRDYHDRRYNEMQALIYAHPVGQMEHLWYDPADPRHSVRKLASPQYGFWQAVFGLFFFAAPLVFAMYMFRLISSDRRR